MSYKDPFRTIVSVAITVIIFSILLKKASLGQVYATVGSADLKLIFLVLLVALFNGFFISSIRWKLILKVMGCHLPHKEAFFIKVGSAPIIGAVPLKIGEISRILYLKKINGIDHESSVFSIFAEYMLNLFTMLFFMSLCLIFVFIKALVSLPGDQPALVLCFVKFKILFSENKWIMTFKKRLLKCFENEKIFKNKKIILFSLLFGFLELVCFYFLSKAINVDLPFSEVFFYLPIIILLSSIPLTFLGLGMREGLVILLFQKYASAGRLLALGILYSFVEHIFPTLIGLGFTSIFINKIINRDKGK